MDGLCYLVGVVRVHQHGSFERQRAPGELAEGVKAETPHKALRQSHQSEINPHWRDGMRALNDPLWTGVRDTDTSRKTRHDFQQIQRLLAASVERTCTRELRA